MAKHWNSSKIPLPRGWPQHARSAMLHVISLAQFALAYTHGWAVNSQVTRVRLKAENDRLKQHVAWLTEEIRIKDVRTRLTTAQRRPRYPPAERMSILELRAARAWSLHQTADAFLVTTETIASWMRRLDEQGPDALVQIREPVNKFPEFVRYAVQRLKTLCPTLGKVKMANMLCRAGLHLGSTTVGRILKESPHPPPRPASVATGRVVTAKKPNHVWHIDLTAVPIGGGFWTPHLPFALPQCWPFCWWLIVIVDHYSRRVIGFAAFSKRPNSLALRTFIGKTTAHIHATPKYLICDKDSIFWCKVFKRWCKRKTIRPRYGAVGKHGSIAVVERLIRTIKDEATRRIVVPQRLVAFRRELTSYVAWYNGHRPHTTLHGKTPNEVYFRLRPANRRPRIEPRKRWSRVSPCARPSVLIAGQPGDRFEIEVGFHDGRRHLPIVTLRRAA